VGGAWHHSQFLLAGQFFKGFLVEAQYDLIALADDEQGGRLHLRQGIIREIWAAST
jgi:hypothetical protein